MEHDIEEDLIAAISTLTVARRKLARILQTYPTPIAGCDAQYNHLLAQRKRIDQALVALESEPFIPTPRQTAAHHGIESR